MFARTRDIVERRAGAGKITKVRGSTKSSGGRGNEGSVCAGGQERPALHGSIYPLDHTLYTIRRIPTFQVAFENGGTEN